MGAVTRKASRARAVCFCADKVEYVVDNIVAMRDNAPGRSCSPGALSVASTPYFAHQLKKNRVDALFPQRTSNAYHRGCKTRKGTGAEVKNMNENLSRIVADLVKSKGGEELSSKIHRLRDEIRKAIGSEDTIFGKIRGLVESFREIIPDEKQRYHAAIKALSTTSKLSREEIVKAVNNQLEELNILEKGLLSGIPGWRDELKVMQAASQEMRDEIATLREKLARLESEEKVILNSMATQEKEMGVVEKAMREVFTEIGADITAIKIKVEEFSAESAVVQPIPPVIRAVAQPVQPVERASAQPVPPGDSPKSDSPSGKQVGVEQKSEIQESAAPPDTEWQKKCPMCGGRMDFQIDGEMWQCYTCAYEEAGHGDVQGKSAAKSEQRNAPKPTPQKDSIISIPSTTTAGVEQKNEIQESVAPQETEWQKKCPMCGGRMDFQIDGKMWQCYTCAHEEAGQGDVQGTSAGKSGQPSPPFNVPLEPLSSNEFQDLIKGSIRGSLSSSKRPVTKTKPCPACRKKMSYHENEKAWRCPHCEYERRI